MINQLQKQMFAEENMSNLTSAAVSGDASVSSGNNRIEPSSSMYPQQQYFSQQNQSQDHDQQPQQPPAKKKRSLPGNPDPDAEVIALSPKSLLATNRFVCEICNKGFQRDQNLQLHRRGHNLPWKLKQRTNKEVRKKVYVCPEPSCVHHDPSRALGDLTGIKKHFCRKHGEKKWKCDKCSKRYAVQSDWKAHSKVCGTREYRCDCGTLFSRRDSFITHRAFCDALAEETARAITTNSLLSNPVAAVAGPSSSSHFINTLQQQQAQFNTQHDPLHSFPLKREQNLINLPPWLACPPPFVGPSPTSAIDRPQHQHQHHLSSPSSSSSIFHQDHQLMQQQDPHHHQQLNHHQQQQQSPNPSNANPNPSMGATSFPSMGTGPYHTQAAPHMSATALLQKAAQMGATMSKTAGSPHHHHQGQGHVSDTNSNTTTTTAGLFGLNLSSRDHQQELMASSTGLVVNHGLSPFGNKAATITPTTPTPTTAATTTIPGGGSDHQFTGPSASPPSSSFLHDMMINSLSSASSYDHHNDAFGIGGMLSATTTTSSKKSSTLAAFHQTVGRRERTDGGGGGGNDGLTRDFLGLRPLSHNEILTIAGLGNCMNSNNNTTPPHDHNQQQDTHNKPWQG